MKLNECFSANKEKIVRIGCFSAGVIVTYVVLKKAVGLRRNNYIVTDFVVSDLGKLGDELVKRGHSANEKVLRWGVDLAKM